MIVLLAVIVFIAGSIYKEFNGYPWEHVRVKKEAVTYMKTKYNMDVKVVGSSFNFKFDNYIVQLYNIHDPEKEIIRVEKQRVYNEGRKAWEKRLEDSYGMVYWSKRINRELRKSYPDFCNHKDIEKLFVDYAYSTVPMGEGVSRDKDGNGVLIPLKPDLSGVLDVDLKTKAFSENFLGELLSLINELKTGQDEIDLFITGTREEDPSGDGKGKTMLIEIPYKEFERINSLEELKLRIRDF